MRNKKHKSSNKTSLKFKIIIIDIVIILIAFFAFTMSSKVSKSYKSAQNIRQNESSKITTEEYEEMVRNWDTTKIHIEYDTKGIAVPVPNGYVASKVDGEHTIDTGFVIYEGETDVTNENAWNESLKRNQWVWIPVLDIDRVFRDCKPFQLVTSKTYKYNSEGREKKVSDNEGVTDVDYILIEIDNLMEEYIRLDDVKTPGYEQEHRDICARALELQYQMRNGTVRGYNTLEPTALDSDTEVTLCKNGLQGITRDEFLQELQIEFEETLQSIKKYGGFYIARYETGNLSKKIPVVQRMNTDISNQSWYDVYTKIKYLGKNENVKTNMIWDCLWDETLEWMVETNCKTYSEIANSSSWGNYHNSTFEYKDISNNIRTKQRNSGEKIPTGSSEYTKSNNIYDLAGNVMENTLKPYDGYNNRSANGGNYTSQNDESTVDYMSGMEPYNKDITCGARAYLYIK